MTPRQAVMPQPVDVSAPDIVAWLDDETFPRDVKVACVLYRRLGARNKTASKGAVITVDREEMEHGLTHGVFIDVDAPLPGTIVSEGDPLDDDLVDDQDDPDLVDPNADPVLDLVRDSNIKEILGRVGDDAILARQVLVIEAALAEADERDPRKGLVEGCEKIIEDHPDDPDADDLEPDPDASDAD